MQKTILFLSLIGLSFNCFSQQQTLVAFDKQRVNITKKSTIVLAGWSAANMIGSAFATKTTNTEMRYFHQMNVLWNGINLGFAALGYWGAGLDKVRNPTLSAILKHQNTSEKTYILNIGLDAAYIAGGLYMTERSKSRLNPAKLKGYGNAVMVQGGFLFLFDMANYLIHHKHGKQLDKLIDKVQVSGVPGGMSVAYRF